MSHGRVGRFDSLTFSTAIGRRFADCGSWRRPATGSR